MVNRGYGLPSQKVPQIVKLAMLLIFNINDSPSVLTASDRLAVNDDVPFWSNDRKRNHVLTRYRWSDETQSILIYISRRMCSREWLRWVAFLQRRDHRYRRGTGVCYGNEAHHESKKPVWQVIINSFLTDESWIWATYPDFECLTLFQCQTVRLGNHRDDIDHLAKFFHDDDVNRLVNKHEMELGKLATSLRGIRRKRKIRFTLRVWPVGAIKYRQQWMRVSWMYLSRIAVSSLRRYAECWSLMYLMIGSQHPSLLTISP